MNKINPFSIQKLEELMNYFLHKGWKAPLGQSNIHSEISHPKINFEDLKENTPPNQYIIDFLGSYHYSKSEHKQGEVTLFEKPIGECVEAYIKGFFNKDNDETLFQEYKLYLVTIVLLHEYVHWIMHCWQSPPYDDNGIIYESNSKITWPDQEKYYSESIAQIYTNWVCSKEKKLWEMFSWLEKVQPKEYTEYHEIVDTHEFKGNDLVNGELPEQQIKKIQPAPIEIIDKCTILSRIQNPIGIKGNTFEILEKNYQYLAKDPSKRGSLEVYNRSLKFGL